jgi:hypothetical protein
MTHNIQLQISGTEVIPQPDPSSLTFAIGDLLTFRSDRGKASVTLEPGHGFSADRFESGDKPLKVERHGRFAFHCSIVLADGSRLGWPQGMAAKSGGEGQT